jgi:hypothetical protein
MASRGSPAFMEAAALRQARAAMVGCMSFRRWSGG